jgi:hypothetical protein
LIDSQVGAPPDVLERLTAMAAKLDAHPSGRPHEARDPELDQFMVRPSSSSPIPITYPGIGHGRSIHRFMCQLITNNPLR